MSAIAPTENNYMEQKAVPAAATTLEERLAALERKFQRPNLTPQQTMEQTFIDLVNPKFKSYTKPLTPALLVGAGTLVLCVIVLIISMNTTITSDSCSTTRTYPQFYERAEKQSQYLIETVTQSIPECTESEKCDGESDGSEYYSTVSLDICLKKEVAIPLTATSSTDTNFQYNVEDGAYATSLHNCLVQSEFMDGQSVSSVYDAAGWVVSWSGESGDAHDPIGYCDDLEDTYSVYVDSEQRSIEGVAALEATGDSRIECPIYFTSMESSESDQVPWLVQYKMTRKECVYTTVKPSFSSALADAFAYAAYLEFAVTAVVIVALKAMKVIKRKDELVFETV